MKQISIQCRVFPVLHFGTEAASRRSTRTATEFSSGESGGLLSDCRTMLRLDLYDWNHFSAPELSPMWRDIANNRASVGTKVFGTLSNPENPLDSMTIFRYRISASRASMGSAPVYTARTLASASCKVRKPSSARSHAEIPNASMAQATQYHNLFIAEPRVDVLVCRHYVGSWRSLNPDMHPAIHRGRLNTCATPWQAALSKDSSSVADTIRGNMTPADNVGSVFVCRVRGHYYI